MSDYATATDREPRTDVAPVALNNSSTGPWLRSWSNGAELFVTDADGRMVRDDRDKYAMNPAYLAANIFRTPDDPKRRWTIKFFLAGELKSVLDQDDVWSLRMARQLLAYLAADWKPKNTDAWLLRRELADAVHAAWLEAADREILAIPA